MPKFFVKIQEIHTQVIEVLAHDMQSAQTAAEQVLSTGVNQDGSDLADAIEYDSTTDCNNWKVWQ